MGFGWVSTQQILGPVSLRKKLRNGISGGDDSGSLAYSTFINTHRSCQHHSFSLGEKTVTVEMKGFFNVRNYSKSQTLRVENSTSSFLFQKINTQALFRSPLGLCGSHISLIPRMS